MVVTDIGPDPLARYNWAKRQAVKRRDTNLKGGIES
jgi:hypothetical protein